MFFLTDSHCPVKQHGSLLSHLASIASHRLTWELCLCWKHSSAQVQTSNVLPWLPEKIQYFGRLEPKKINPPTSVFAKCVFFRRDAKGRKIDSKHCVVCFARPLQISVFLVGLHWKLEVIKVNKALIFTIHFEPLLDKTSQKKLCSTHLLKKHVNSMSFWTMFVLHPAKTSYIDSAVSSKVRKSPKYIVFDPGKNKVWQIFHPGAAPAAERREYHWHCEISFIMPQKRLKIKYGLKSDRLSICHLVSGSLAIFQPSPVVSTKVVPLASPAISNTGMSQSELRCKRLFYHAAGTYAIYFRNPGTLETIDVSGKTC